MDIEGKQGDPNVTKAMNELKSICLNVTAVGGPEVPWFPTQLEDFDHIGKKCLSEGEGIQESDHPSFRDPVYRKRRDEITNVAFGYDLKDAHIPNIEYNDDERSVWKYCYPRLMEMYKTNGCKEFNWTIQEF